MTLFFEPGDELLDELRDLNPEQMTPLEALQRLVEWKRRFK